jgi:hypothetical protein
MFVASQFNYNYDFSPQKANANYQWRGPMMLP